jgi:Tripartite tricarboxylate transporter TctB family
VIIKSQKDFFSGLMFMVVGMAFAVGAYNYGMGDGAKMGPGYFPRMLGVLLGLLGAFIMFKALTVATSDGEKLGKWAWGPMACILGANVIFGVMLGGLPSIKLPAMGLIMGIYALTFIASLASERFNVKEVFILATGLALLSYVAFVVLLKLQFPVWPAFITEALRSVN